MKEREAYLLHGCSLQVVRGLEIVEGAALLLDLDRLGSGLGLSLVLLGRISVKVF